MSEPDHLSQTTAMPDPDTLFHAHLPLADKMAGGYANTPVKGNISL